jgi:hypothetical protein
VFNTSDNFPDKIKNNELCAGIGGSTISQVAAVVAEDYGKIDMMMHSLANDLDVMKPLLKTPHKGCLVTLLASACLAVSLLKKSGLIMNKGESNVSSPGTAAGCSAPRSSLSLTPTLSPTRSGVNETCVSTPCRQSPQVACGQRHKKAGKKMFIKCDIDCSKTNTPMTQGLCNDGGSLRANPDCAVCGHHIMSMGLAVRN